MFPMCPAHAGTGATIRCFSPHPWVCVRPTRAQGQRHLQQCLAQRLGSGPRGHRGNTFRVTGGRGDEVRPTRAQGQPRTRRDRWGTARPAHAGTIPQRVKQPMPAKASSPAPPPRRRGRRRRGWGSQGGRGRRMPGRDWAGPWAKTASSRAASWRASVAMRRAVAEVLLQGSRRRTGGDAAGGSSRKRSAQRAGVWHRQGITAPQGGPLQRIRGRPAAAPSQLEGQEREARSGASGSGWRV